MLSASTYKHHVEALLAQVVQAGQGERLAEPEPLCAAARPRRRRPRRRSGCRRRRSMHLRPVEAEQLAVALGQEEAQPGRTTAAPRAAEVVDGHPALLGVVGERAALTRPTPPRPGRARRCGRARRRGMTASAIGGRRRQPHLPELADRVPTRAGRPAAAARRHRRRAPRPAGRGRPATLDQAASTSAAPTPRPACVGRDDDVCAARTVVGAQVDVRVARRRQRRVATTCAPAGDRTRLGAAWSRSSRTWSSSGETPSAASAASCDPADLCVRRRRPGRRSTVSSRSPEGDVTAGLSRLVDADGSSAVRRLQARRQPARRSTSAARSGSRRCGRCRSATRAPARAWRAGVVRGRRPCGCRRSSRSPRPPAAAAGG